MQASRFLIVDGELTGEAACRGIGDLDTDGTITLVCDEPHPPYSRPPLSKALWTGAEESTVVYSLDSKRKPRGVLLWNRVKKRQVPTGETRQSSLSCG